MATGFFGKLPAHGDFLRRGLPDSFVEPWDAWLQDGIAEAREALGDGFPDAWSAAPPWRFHLPAGICGDSAIAGLIMPSEDMVGRRFPLTLVALLAEGEPAPSEAWFDALEAAGRLAREDNHDADALAAVLPARWPDDDPAPEGWWVSRAGHWPLPGLPPPALFKMLIEGGA